MGKQKKSVKKKVSLIIPFYKQMESELAVPLSSINNQIGVDFATLDVHLVNDGGTPIDISKFAIFANLDLHYHELPENIGPGLARQYGIDHSEGEYIIFIDSDDELTYNGLAGFYLTIENSGEHDILTSNFINQERDSQSRNKYIYRLSTADRSFNQAVVYAKWFRRLYLRKNKIGFSPDLTRVYEDTYLTSVAFYLTEDSVQTGHVSYIRCFAKQSLTHSVGAQFNPLDKYVLMNRLVLEKIQQIVPEKLGSKLTNVLVNIYFTYKMSPTANEEEFWKELRQLLAQFPYNIEANLPTLQWLANQWAVEENGVYKAIDPNGLQGFLKQI